MKVAITVGEAHRTLQVVRRGNRLRVTLEDGREVELRVLSDRDGRFELEHGYARIHGAGVALGCERHFWANGRTLTYHCERPTAARLAEAEASLASPLPAVVLEVLVEPGDEVTASQKLVLLESMKTVIMIRAPQAGVVRCVRCRPGDAVAAGLPLVELGPDGQGVRS
jgi:acetyl/propionyl-CoA carboxylase alpha subunit